jgi:hypothetical protein
MSWPGASLNPQPTTPQTILSKNNAASRNREAIKSQMASDLLRLHFITPSNEINR